MSHKHESIHVTPCRNRTHYYNSLLHPHFTAWELRHKNVLSPETGTGNGLRQQRHNSPEGTMFRSPWLLQTSAVAMRAQHPSKTKSTSPGQLRKWGIQKEPNCVICFTSLWAWSRTTSMYLHHWTILSLSWAPWFVHQSLQAPAKREAQILQIHVAMHVHMN